MIRSRSAVLPRSIENALARLGRRPVVSGACISLVALILAFGLSLKDWPQPTVHDEFSYLLAAETFAEGRITNPTHPHWRHFETFHVLHQPTYQSKYPPGQGLALAAGLVTADRPIVGAWLATALACAAVFWMLLGWTTPRWALVGGILTALHLGIVGTWSQIYWGGSVGLIGGALALGGLRRILQLARVRDGAVCGLGLTILAHSRPFEGALLALSCLVALPFLVYWMPLARRRLTRAWQPPILALASVGLLGLMTVAYYNARITGDPFTFPHQVWQQTYSGAAASQVPRRIAEYTGSDPHTLLHRIGRIVQFYVNPAWLFAFLALPWVATRSLGKGLAVFGGMTALLASGLSFYFIPLLDRVGVLTLILGLGALLLLVRKVSDLWVYFAVLVIIILGAISVTTTRGWPHYISPTAPLWIYLVVQTIRYVRIRARRDSIFWRWFALAVPLLALASAGSMLHVHERTEDWAQDRAYLVRALEADQNDHLILVRYPDTYPVHDEWVYNQANIDRSRVVWARELATEKDELIIQYFADRCVWLLTPTDELNRGELPRWLDSARLIVHPSPAGKHCIPPR